MIELKKSILFVRAKGDNEYLDITNRGYTVVDPYYGKKLFARLLRELFFRLRLPFRKAWYRKIPKIENYDYVIIFDPLITEDYLKWLLKKTSLKTKLVFTYGNLIGNARHIQPNKIPQKYEVFTYDENDAAKYGLKLNNHVMLSPKALSLTKTKKEFDVTFIGIDKGRGPQLKKIEKRFQRQGLKTFFYIVPNRKHPLQNRSGLKPLKYSKFLNYVSKSKAILNYVYEEQSAISLRDIEALSNGIKLITNNQSIRERFFYNSDDIFVLGIDDESNLSNFIEKPFRQLPPSFFSYYSFESWLSTFTEVTLIQ